MDRSPLLTSPLMTPASLLSLPVVLLSRTADDEERRYCTPQSRSASATSHATMHPSPIHAWGSPAPALVAPHAATTHPPTMTHTALAHLSSKARSRRRVTSAAAVTAGANALAICAVDSDTYVRAKLAKARATAAKTPVGRTYVTHWFAVSRVLSSTRPIPTSVHATIVPKSEPSDAMRIGVRVLTTRCLLASTRDAERAT
mmetsp:Transcript_10620/g.47874  ORF Transcript_10620/g.47874 Transcript_10620/m.47874 type:complete len:201 (+) Transcript_10620:431-1033(+)